MNVKMTDDRSIALEKNKIIIKAQGTPILVKKENKIKVLQGDRIINNIKFGPASSLYQEDVIFESQPGGLIRDSPVKITITNRFDLLKNFTRTVITYLDPLNGKILSEKTSDQMVRFIGQNNYEAVIAALLMVSDEEAKVKAIMALLTTASVEDQTTQTTPEHDFDAFPEVKIKTEPSKTVEEKCCQTDENCMDLIYKLKQRKRVRRNALTPYPVKDAPAKIIKKVVVNPTKPPQHTKKDTKPNLVLNSEDPKGNTITNITEKDVLPVITGYILDDSSNDGTLSLSGSLISDAGLQRVENQYLLGIGKHTTAEPTTVTILNSEKHFITLPGGEMLTVPVKPEFPYHMATPEILKSLTDEDKRKLIGYQYYLDFKMCLTRSSDGYLPIHYAVLNNDIDLLKRQCVVLKYRHQTLDVPYGNLTPLQLSISLDTPQCTALLLQQGADPLLTDDEQRTCLHLASESTSDHLRAVINHCESNAKQILQDNELWKADYEGKSNDILAAILLKHMCEMFDDQGYTPLMVAAKSGNYTGVKMIIEASPDCIDIQMPNCGNSALFLAVEGACHDASNRGNKSKVADHYNRTISILLENHADVTKPNHSGITINDLLTDNNNAELSTIFANKVTSRFFDGHLPGGSKFDNYMLVKNKEGNVDIAELKPAGTDFESYITPKIIVGKSKEDISLAELKKIDEGNAKTAKNKIIIKVTEDKNPVLQNKPIVAVKRGRKPTKKEKPIILENITLPQSKPILDLNTVKAQNVKFINPNDKLVKTAVPKPSNIKMVAPTFVNKRKSLNEPGPSEKKMKGLNT